jgi:hypothetical protein
MRVPVALACKSAGRVQGQRAQSTGGSHRQAPEQRCALCGHSSAAPLPSRARQEGLQRLHRMQPALADIGKKLAHDFKNPLNAVFVLAGALERGTEAVPCSHSWLRTAISSGTFWREFKCPNACKAINAASSVATQPD